jgi:hypothetical protein
LTAAHDEDASVGKLVGPAVLAGMQLECGRRGRGRPLRRAPERAGRDDDVPPRERTARRLDPEPAVGRGAHGRDFDPRADVPADEARVLLEMGNGLVARQEAARIVPRVLVPGQL